MFHDSGFTIQGLEFKVRGVGFRVYAAGVRKQGVGFRVKQSIHVSYWMGPE
jgi:hypothetical protein